MAKYYGIVALNPAPAFLGGIDVAGDEDEPEEARRRIRELLPEGHDFPDGLILVELVPVERIVRRVEYEPVEPVVPAAE